MSEFSSNDVFTLTTARILPARPEAVFSAIADPALLTRWWGPNGFSSSFQTFDFRPGGDWVFTLHGPDGTDYPNVCRFIEIVADQRVVIEHLNMHWFELTLSLAPQDGGTRNGCAVPRVSHHQNIQPASANADAPIASASPLPLSIVESEPAITAFTSRPRKACSEDALPRCCGYMSRMARVMIGKASAMPNALRLAGSTAHGNVG